MTLDEGLAQRIRDQISDHAGYEEKRMFSGIGFLLKGNMACGVNKENLIIRVGPDYYQEALSKPNAKIFDMTGRPMTGWIVVTEADYQKDADFQEWVDRGVAFALTLPAK
ncbi:MAG: RNA methyltransferase [Chloroflexota bacterium]|nr:MAG: RNA methyltransferase [Chloroflexota bacterium]HDD61297.1 TfoX family protein [Chloroflexota bacterium]